MASSLDNKGEDAEAPLLLPTAGSQPPPPALSSYGKTFANLVLCIIGTGVLGLPYTFSTIGWAMGCIVLVVSAAVAYYGMMLIVRAKRIFLRTRASCDAVVLVASYGDLMFHVFGRWGRTTVDVLLALSTLACGISYLTFISQNLASIAAAASGTSAGTHLSAHRSISVASDHNFHGDCRNLSVNENRSFHGELRCINVSVNQNHSFYGELRCNNLSANQNHSSDHGELKYDLSVKESQSLLINHSEIEYNLSVKESQNLLLNRRELKYNSSVKETQRLLVNHSFHGDKESQSLLVNHSFHGDKESQSLLVNHSFHGDKESQSLLFNDSFHGDLTQSLIGNGTIAIPGRSSSNQLGLSWSSSSLYAWGIFPFEVALAAVPSLTYLAPFSTLADTVNLAALAAVMVSDVLQILKNSSFESIKAFSSLVAVPSAFGVGIYAFQSAGMMIPIELSMAQPSKLGSILGWAFVLSGILYAVFAVLGYAAFGENTQQIITLNLQDGIEPMLIKAAISLALFFAFPLMLNPMCELMERRFAKRKRSVWLRAIVVLVICFLATEVTQFADFLSLAGSSISCLLGFILPAALHLKVMKEDPQEPPSFSLMAIDYILIVFGLVFGAFGTTVSFMKLL